MFMVSIIEWVYWKLFFLFKPSYWSMKDPYNMAWDEWLIYAMKTHKFKHVDFYHAELNGKLIWIKNHPYGSFGPAESTGIGGIRPSRKTIFLANQKYINDVLNEGVPCDI